MLWKNANGSISIWSVYPNLNYVTSHVYGTYAGWIPESITVSEDGANTLRVIWREIRGQVSVWALDANLNLKGTCFREVVLSCALGHRFLGDSLMGFAANFKAVSTQKFTRILE